MVTAPPRSERRAPWNWVDVFLVLVLSYVAGLVAYAIVASLVHTVDGSLSKQDRSAVEAMSGQLVFYAVAISITLIILVTRRNIDVRDIGWRSASWRWLLAAIPLALLGLAVAGALSGVAQSLLPHAQNVQCQTVQSEFGRSGRSVLLAFPLVCIAAPIVEETIFRGVLYRWLRGVLPLGTAMLVSGGIFALFHGIVLLFLPLLGLGVLLSWIYERTQSIWPGALVHGLFNLVGLINILTVANC